MSDHAAFLRAIEAAPRADLPRLAFADWLDDHGDPDRALFVRLQCEAHRLRHGPPPDRPTADRLDRRADTLLAKHEDRWRAGLPRWTAAGLRFERGFLHVYSLTGKQFAEHAGLLRAVAPVGGWLALRLLKGREAAVFGSLHLEMVSRLGLDGSQLTDAGAAHLAAGPHLRRVAGLDVGNDLFGGGSRNALTDAALRALAGTDHLPALTALAAEGLPRVTPAGVAALVTSEKRAGLTDLRLGGGTGGPGVAGAFADPNFRLARLHRLGLGGGRVGDTAAAVLAGCAGLAALTSLHLYDTAVTDAGVQALLASPHLRRLTVLTLDGVRRPNPRVTDATARAVLADGRPWRAVGLDNTGVSPEMRAEVAARCR